MRVLICDQESEMLETVARWFAVDTATSKATCIDLMRANPFDVLIASERLADGSGLELLSHVATRWPDTLRVLAIEPERLRLLRGKLAPFRLHATMRYPIEEDELEAVLNRMGELMGGDEGEEELAPEAPLSVPPAHTPKSDKRPSFQEPANGSSSATRANTSGPRQSAPTVRPPVSSPTRQPTTPIGRSPPTIGPSTPPKTTPKPTSQSIKAAPPLGAPLPPTPPPVRRKLGNYTPLGSPDDDRLRIVQREFDHTAAPLAARAIRAREQANRPRTQTEKLGTLTTHLSETLKKLLKR